MCLMKNNEMYEKKNSEKNLNGVNYDYGENCDYDGRKGNTHRRLTYLIIASD